jgi:predicted helicase
MGEKDQGYASTWRLTLERFDTSSSCAALVSITNGKPLDWRVEKVQLSKDKRSLIYNDFLTLSGIPHEVFEYRLGNRSALDWIIDQYQVSTDKRSGITNDPNRADDPEYIVRLIGKVINGKREPSSA